MGELGVTATVVMSGETHGPRTLHERGGDLRTVTVFPGPSEDSFSEAGYAALKAAEVDDAVLPMDSARMEEPLVQELNIVSIYALHVALYALQNPTPENVRRALYRLGTSGDLEEHVDNESLMPLPIDEPAGWGDWLPDLPERIGPFDGDELVRWAGSYGHPEEWAKKAQALHGEVEKLRTQLQEAG